MLLHALPPPPKPNSRPGLVLITGFALGLMAASAWSSLVSGWDPAPAVLERRPGGPASQRAGGAHQAPPAPSMPAKGQGPIPGQVMALPSQASYKRLQQNPGLLKGDHGLLEEFEAAPWLLPARTPQLPYANLHSFEKLLALRSRPVGSLKKSITLLLFSKAWAVMAQNSIYSLVKHGGVSNHIALTWTAEDLEACADLNLPCGDVADMLVEPLKPGKKGSEREHNFLLMSWLKPAVVLRALRLGHSVMVADVDIAYAVKPLWESYLAFTQASNSDGAWLEEKPASNTGHFVLLPTPASLAFAAAWNASAAEMMKEKLTDQKALPLLEGRHYLRCNTLCRCFRAAYNLTARGERGKVAAFRTYLPSHFAYSPNWCTIGSPEWVPRIDPCDWAVLYLHIICEAEAAVKQSVLRAAGFWFVDDEKGCKPQPGSASGVPACQPLRWRLPQTEAGHYRCRSFDLGLVHGGEPAAGAVARAGVRGKAAEELFDLIKDKKC